MESREAYAVVPTRQLNALITVSHYVLNDKREYDDYCEQCECQGLDIHQGVEHLDHVYAHALIALNIEFTCDQYRCPRCNESINTQLRKETRNEKLH